MPVYQIDRIEKVPSDTKFFIDTNIWLYLYGPHCDHTDNRVKSYSNFLKLIIEEERNSIFIDYLVIAEFINRYVRDTFKLQHASDFKNFKDFRSSEEHSALIESLSDELYHITQDTETIYCDLAKLDLDELIKKTSEGKADFNDIVIMTICELKGLNLITDDADFPHENINIYTSNKRLGQ